MFGFVAFRLIQHFTYVRRLPLRRSELYFAGLETACRTNSEAREIRNDGVEVVAIFMSRFLNVDRWTFAAMLTSLL